MKPMLLLVLALLQAGAVPAPPAADEAVILIPYREIATDGSYCDWGNGHCGVTGRALIMKDLTIEVFHKITQQEAADEGRRRLVKHLAGLRIDSGSRLEDRSELITALTKQLDALPPEETDTSRAMFEARLKLPLRGQDRLMSLVLPAARAVYSGTDATVPAAAEAQTGNSEPRFTGLIVDARHLVARNTRPVPAILPRVLDAQGGVLYSSASVDPLYGGEMGVAAYMQRIHPHRIAPELIRHRPREGGRPLTVKAVSTAGDARCDLVVSDEDASLIREAALTVVLSEARVIVLMPPPPSPEATPVRRRAPQPAGAATPTKDRS